MSPLDTDLHHALSATFTPPGQPPPFVVSAHHDANRGKGVFSRVIRVELAWQPGSADRPTTVIVKLPALGANGEAARRSGAYQREALAYRTLLPPSPVQVPHVHGVITTDDRATFVLEDLGTHRFVDQMIGLEADDARAVAVELRRFHQFWENRSRLGPLDLRRATPTDFDAEALAAGVDALSARWDGDLTPTEIEAFRRLVANRTAVVDAFAAAGPPTLCHGDPRADNLAFAADGRPVLFDWQQPAIQTGAADLAWLAATSMTVAERRAGEAELVAAYGTDVDRYRLGFVLPGLAVLLLAQREITSERSRTFVATSLHRVAGALIDLDIAAIRP